MEMEGESNILSQLRPPRLEDAGLEDSALPPDAIREAFSIAATAVNSRFSSLVTGEGEEDEGDEVADCVKDQMPPCGDSIESLIGLAPVTDPHQRPCAGEKYGGGIPEVLGDEVAANMTGAEVNKAVGGTGVEDEGGKSSVDGLQGLEIGDEKKKKKKDDAGDDDGDDERPILVEGSA